MKKIKLITFLAFIIVIFVVLIFHLLPVTCDAGACGGGFKEYIFNKYDEELLCILNEQDERFSYDIVIGSQNVFWKGRNLYINFDVNYYDNKNLKTKTITFCGKRIWFEKYIWKLN
jgi:hypothetical protein